MESLPILSLSSLLFITNLLVSLVLMIICILRMKLISFQSNTNKNLPPSPPRLPIIGNFHQLGSNPHYSLKELSQRHGPIMLLRLGSVPMLVASSSQAAQEIMKTHDISFSSRPNSHILNILLYGCKDIAFSPNNEYWRQLKSIVVSHLLSNAQVKSFQKVREKEIGLVIESLNDSCGSSVDMSALLVSLAENVMCRVALGKKIDGLKLTSLLRRYLNMFNLFSVGSYIPWLSWVDQLTGLVGKAEKVVNEFDEFLEDVIREHENKKKLDEDNVEFEEGKDFIDMLLSVQKDVTMGFAFQKDTIKAVILDIFGGGIDSVFTSMEWIMSELVKHPRVMKKLQKEITEVLQERSVISEEDLERMQYLKAVIKESWRLHPPVPTLIPRKSTQDVKLMGYDIPAGTQAMINVWQIGRDPALWEEPNEFKPERFSKNTIINYRGPTFDVLPFGAGRRSCPGTQFGAAVIELAIANIVQKFNFALPDGVKNEDLDMTDKYGITVHRKFPLQVIASPRF
uniref:cytochrome P450 Tp4149-like n=1 Tax=Erigeron canadensis TaxID=72917 RepID=UPI001CB92EBC|nr:cytochrome P450 Tp4149-like [Erigeron canadensis]